MDIAANWSVIVSWNKAPLTRLSSYSFALFQCKFIAIDFFFASFRNCHLFRGKFKHFLARCIDDMLSRVSGSPLILVSRAFAKSCPTQGSILSTSWRGHDDVVSLSPRNTAYRRIRDGFNELTSESLTGGVPSSPKHGSAWPTFGRNAVAATIFGTFPASSLGGPSGALCK